MENGNAELFNDLDGVVRTLYFARSAYKAFVEVYDNTFLLFDLENIHRANVHACSTSSTLFEVDFDLHHDLSPSF